MPEQAYRYTFRPLTRADLPQIAAWLKEPHVARWYGELGQELRHIEEHLTSVSVEPFIVMLNDQPIGYIQSYDPHKEDDHPYRDHPVGTLGIDQFIGKPELTGKGHGPRFIDTFVRDAFAKGAPRVLLDPDPANLVAIRAYMKAGFRVLGPRTSIYGPALMMARDAQEQSK